MATAGGRGDANKVLSITIRGIDQLSPVLRAVTSVVTRFARVVTLPFVLLGKAIGALLHPLRLFQAVIAFLAVRAIIRFTQAAADAGDAVEALSNKLGIGMKEVQEWAFIADQAGTSVDSLATAWKKLAVNVSEAAIGQNDTSLSALAELGLNAGTLRNQSPDKQFEAVAAAMDKVKNQSDRLRLAVALLGRDGAEALKIVAQGSAELERMRLRAAELNAVMSPGQVRILANLQDAFAEVRVAFEGFRNLLVTSVGPALTKFLSEAATKIAEFARKVTQIVSAAFAAFTDNGDLGKRARETFSAIGLTLAQLGTVFGEGFMRSFWVGALAFIDTAIPTLKTFIGTAFGRLFLGAISFALNKVASVMNGRTGAWGAMAASFVQFAKDVENSIGSMDAVATPLELTLRQLNDAVKAGGWEVVTESNQQMIEATYAKIGELAPLLREMGVIGQEAFDKLTKAADKAATSTANVVNVTSKLKDFYNGFKETISEWMITATEAGQLIAQTFTTTVDSMIDDAYEGTLDIVQSFKNMGKEIAKIITKILVQQAALRIVSAFFPGFNPSAAAPAIQAAGGGHFMTHGPTHLTVGDNPGGRELVSVIPLSGRGTTRVRGGALKLAGGGLVDAYGGGQSGGGDRYNITIQAVDAQSFEQLLARRGSKIVKGIVQHAIHHDNDMKSTIRSLG